MGEIAPCDGPIAVVGAGIVGSATAWWLGHCGAEVVWIAPQHPDQPEERASQGALGVLMGHCSRRRRGRSWQLRRSAMNLWQQWLPFLGPIPQQWGLTVLCHRLDEVEALQALAFHRQEEGFPLVWRSREELIDCWPLLTDADLQGGLWSPQDGQLDPAPLLHALATGAEQLGVQRWPARVKSLQHKCGHWHLQLQADHTNHLQTCHVSAVVLCTGLGTGQLLATVDWGNPFPWPMAPVVGQAAELHCPMLPPEALPGPVVWGGVNIIPRPQNQYLWLGATVESGSQGREHCFTQMVQLEDRAPPWLRQAQVVGRWQGLRPRPVGKPAPLLEVVAPGLLLTSGHYRNGILLAPVTALWTSQQLGVPMPRDLALLPRNGAGDRPGP